ncbi:MAG: hypothetical protein SPJ80_04740 [Bacilli bacterium]|nr:hypothetical protein [Bacilli bacterium]
MNKFKKKTRSKMIAASIAILSSAAVVSTGFAAWVISGGDSKQAEGTIAADTVSDAVHTLSELTWDTNGGKISFGAPTTSSGGAFLNYTGEIREKLVATGTFTVSNLKAGWSIASLFKTDGLKITEKVDSGKTAVYPTDGIYVCKLPSYKIGAANDKEPGVYVEAADDTTDGAELPKGNFKLSVVFGWGTQTGKQNPFTYYEKMSNDSTNRSNAKTVLDEVYKLNGCKFSITIETNAQ